jgi:hypothetical protein
MSAVSKKDIELAEEASKDMDRNKVSRFGWITEDGKFVKAGSHICHAALRRSYGEGAGKNMKHVINFPQKPHSYVTDEVAKKFYDWMANGSPFAKVYLTKDPDVIHKGYALLDIDQDQNLLTGACIAGRFISEPISSNNVSKHFSLWSDLVIEHKANPEAAFAFAHMFSDERKDSYPKYYNPKMYHVLFTPSTENKEYVHNFINGKVTQKNPTYREDQDYGSIEGLWRGKKGGNTNGDVCAGLKPRVVKKIENWNIFDSGIRKGVAGYLFKDKEEIFNAYDQWWDWLGAA